MISKCVIDAINTFVCAKLTHGSLTRSSYVHVMKILETFRKLKRRQQLERGEPNDLMSKTIA